MTTRSLKLAAGLNLPVETVTQKLAWLGVTGSGKTYGASKLAELLWHAGAQFVVLDPVGVWYGLRLEGNGKTPSAITVPIFGGLHGDVPLEPTGGALLANLIVDKTLSAVVDVSQFESDAQKARFAHDFAARLFFRKKAAPSALHLFLEEAQEFVPQNPARGEEQMLHVFVRLQKLGRNFGIGSSYISQRPQEVNKKALNMAQTLFVFRTTGTHERDAIEKWIEDKALDEDIAGDLPKIATGDCHVWSPEFLKVSETVHIFEKETYNASATPEVGVTAKARELAPIDLDQVRKDMAATIERAKNDDPRELRQQIADLRKQLSSSPGKAAHGTTASATRDKPVLTDADRAFLVSLDGRLSDTMDAIAERADLMLTSIAERAKAAIDASLATWLGTAVKARGEFLSQVEKARFQKILGKLTDIAGRSGEPTPRSSVGSGEPRRSGTFEPRPAPVRRPSDDRPVTAGFNAGQQKILDVVMMLNARGIEVSRESVESWIESKPGKALHPKGGTFGQNIAALRDEGYLDGFALTDKGQKAATRMYTGLDAARELLNGGPRAIVDVLAHAGHKTYTRETLAAELELHPKGGTFGQNIARLRTMGLIPDRGDIHLTEAAHR